MILVAIKGLYDAAGVAAPVGLARQVSALSGPESLAPLLDEAWSRLPAATLKVRDVEIEPVDQLMGGLVEDLPGGARVLSAQELRVEEQLAGNRYVGLHIALGFDKDAKRASITQVFKGGPADLAGVKDGDVIEEIDGNSTEGMPMPKVVERLRGAEGTQVVIRVRQPKAGVARVFTITRGTLPQITVKGIQDHPDGSAKLLMSSSEPIGYLKFEAILGSTPHELRKLARRLEEEGARALVLDLRPVGQVHLHPTVLLADSLLDGGTIGAMRTSHGIETFQAEPDALFPGWPLAVLVDKNSSPTVRWLAAALQYNHRAIVVGPEELRGVGPQGLRRARIVRNNDDAYVRSAVPIGDGSTSIQMATGRLVLGDGRLLVATDQDTKDRLAPDIVAGATNTFVSPEDTLKNDPWHKGDFPLVAAIQKLRQLLKSP
jgi:carboxyl-terminal processing protease